MNESDARAWIAEHYGDAAFEQLEAFTELLVSENDQQNLISASTIDAVWTRHILDSAQLALHAPTGWRHWLDVGSGAGLPGMVIALLFERPVTLVEPRRLRVEFMRRCCDSLGLSSVTLVQAKAENATVEQRVDVISARAVAKLDALFSSTRHLAAEGAMYILPKGESAHSEVAVARRSWHGTFHVKQSIVDPRSGIVIATGVSRR